MKTDSRRMGTSLFSVIVVVCVCTGLFVSGCGKKKDEPQPATKGLPAQPAAPAPAVKVQTDPKAIVVKVGDKALTKGELDEQVGRIMASPQLQSMPPESMSTMEPRISKDIIERFVGQCVLLHEADVKKVTVTDKDRQTLMDEIKASLPEGMTLEQAITSTGSSLAEFEKQVGEDLKIRKLLEAQTEAVPAPTTEEIRAFYTNSPASFQLPENAHVRHILIKCDPKDTDAAKKEKKQKAESLREQLVKGADFAELAKANSDCPSKAKGGDLGRITKGRTVPPFELAVFSQELKAIGPVVETDFGYHIIQVLDKKDAGLLSFEDAEKDIKEELLNKKRQQAVSEYVKKLKSEAKIEYVK